MKQFINKITKTCNPVSIFLYGSRSRKDSLKKSDYEIGIIFPPGRYMNTVDLKKTINQKGLSAYPFDIEEFTKGLIDTPFQKNIFLRELKLTGKTLYGEKVIENMKVPAITIFDVAQDLRFNIGYALAAVISHRNKDYKTAAHEFYKSCLFGTRNLLLLKKRKFTTSYDEIYKYSQQLDLNVYTDLVKKAYDCRKGKAKCIDSDIFLNISYLNKFIESQVLKYLNKFGNKTLMN